MLTTEAVRRTQLALSNPHPERCHDALDALGWNDDNASVVWSPAPFGLGQFHIGIYPTGASITRQVAPQTAAELPEDWWKGPYYGDYRWGLRFEHGRIQYCDLVERKECTLFQSELSASVLHGLTPQYFSKQGRLEPIGGSFTTIRQHPGPRAADYFCGVMESWFQDYLATGAAQEPEAKDHFTRILSAFILLRTIEDVKRLDWLKPGTLVRAARAGKSTIGPLLQRAARELNSRVLRGVGDILPDDARVRNLVESFYTEQLDFATLEADPVGTFYQNVLGTRYDLKENSQRDLFGEKRAVMPDRSLRKQRGAYFTPREYADLLASRLVHPSAINARSPEELPVVLDLAAGSGQLLCAALRQIFMLPRWRQPQTALQVLDRCIYAVDDDPNAPQLAALNVLRTAVQFAPDILGSGLKFPSMEKNFIHGNALKQSTLDRLPDVDIVLLNPPFHGARKWSPPDEAIPEVNDLARRAHSAFAFCIAGIKKLRPGGDLGVLMPAQPIRGKQYQGARSIVAKHLCIETIVINEAADAFGGAQSYVSVVLGHKEYGAECPGTQVITVTSEKGADIGALAAGAWREGSHARAALVTLSPERPGDWTGEEADFEGLAKTSSGSGEYRVPRVRLSDLLETEVHQCVSCAPLPWKRDLFLFRIIAPDVAQHELSGATVKILSQQSLKRVAIPNDMMLLPPLGEPRSGRDGNLRVFLPGNGSPEGIEWKRMRGSDPTGYAICKIISEIVMSTKAGSLNEDALAFQKDVERGIVRFSWNRGYSSADKDPLLLLSQGANRLTKTEHKLLWSCWVNMRGDFVPLGGNWIRVKDRKWAIALAALLNVPQAVMSVLRNASIRRQGTTQPPLSALNAWQIPDLSDERCAKKLNELEEALIAYRRRCASMRRDDALQLPEWAQLLQLGEELWEL